jgi:5-formyltetrahydrofolate cyclo-ligase
MIGQDVRHKDFLRRHFRDIVRGLPTRRRSREARKAADRLARLPVFVRAPAVAVYVARPGEMDTGPLIALCRRAGKTVLAPIVDPSTQTLRFAVWSGRGKPNVYGIPEPRTDRRSERGLGGRDLLVVPGTAFTRVGDRLGAGGGYFDRFLARSSVQTAALAFPEQIATRLPRRAHDRRVGVVVTAYRTYTP